MTTNLKHARVSWFNSLISDTPRKRFPGSQKYLFQAHIGIIRSHTTHKVHRKYLSYRIACF